MLRPRKKLTRHEIKEDALVTAYSNVRKVIQKNQKIIQYGLLLLIGIIVIGVLMIRSKKSAEKVASEKLSIAEQYYYINEYKKATASFKELIDTYPGAEASGYAAFLLANIYFQQQNYGEAEKYYRLFYDQYSKKGFVAASSLAGIAACMEMKNAFKEAAILYEKAGKSSKNSFSAPFYLKNAARCYIISDKKDKAKLLYQDIISNYPESNTVREIEFLINTL